MTATYRRPVSPGEWSFLSNPPWAPMVIQLVVEGTGSVSREELAAALAVAGYACPGSRLVRRGREWVDSGVTPRVVEVSPGESHGWDRTRLDLAALRRPLHGRGDGPTCEVLLLPEPDTGSTTIVFRAYHGVMDGQGALTWVGEVFRALRGEPAQPAPDTITDTQLLSRLLDRAPGREEAQGIPAPLTTPDTFKRRGVLYRRRTIDGTFPAAVSKLAVALTRSLGAEPRTMLVPVDLRRHDPTIRSTGNLTLNVAVEVAPGAPWQQVHQDLLTALTEERELDRTPQEGMLRMPLRAVDGLGWFMDNVMARLNYYGGSFFLTHLGKIDPAEWSTPTFHARTVYSPPTRGRCCPPVISLVELPGRTEIVLAADGGPGNDARADRLVDDVVDSFSPPAARHWPGNATDAPVPRTATLASLFDEQARRRPDAVALTDDAGGSTTYAELRDDADRVARALADRGVGRGDLVGLVADRTPASLAGLWGVLRAGAAYLPLDRSHPDARLADLLADAGAAVCLTGRRHADRALEAPLLVLEDVLADRTPAPAPADPPAPDDLAYVIYTSGSTGRPKGVEIEHRNVVNYVTWARERFGVDDDTRFGLFSSLAFDLPGTALFTALTSGASLALVDDDPNHVVLRSLLTERGVNALKCTPSHLELFSGLGLEPSGFRLLVVGGERLRGPVAQRAREQFGPGCRLVNHYGPTEATIGCIVHPVTDADAAAAAVPIGRPVANTRVVIADEDRRRVAPGEVGELYVTGAQLARGYRDRPAMTRERFVHLADGTRAYRTGDLVHVDADGEIVYDGRADDQVKVLGHRIEPGEIAAALSDLEGVERAVVVPRDRAGGDKYLAAYVVGAGPLDADTLAADLGERVPHYMVPTAILQVDDIPQTPNGKLDVRALPDPFASSDAPTVAPVEPRDELEEEVAAIWEETLGVDRDRVRDDSDFHRLGGDSMALLRMLAAVSSRVIGEAGEQEFMTELTDVITAPTFERVCSRARDARTPA